MMVILQNKYVYGLVGGAIPLLGYTVYSDFHYQKFWVMRWAEASPRAHHLQLCYLLFICYHLMKMA